MLYEMLTGKRLFGGEAVSDALAVILTREPDMSTVPAKVRRLLQARLQKDPKRRDGGRSQGLRHGLQAGIPRALFPVPAQEQYDVSKSGRFLIHVPVNQNATGVPITVVKNWQAALKK